MESIFVELLGTSPLAAAMIAIFWRLDKRLSFLEIRLKDQLK